MTMRLCTFDVQVDGLWYVWNHADCSSDEYMRIRMLTSSADNEVACSPSSSATTTSTCGALLATNGTVCTVGCQSGFPQSTR